MQTARSRRAKGWAIAASVAAHLAVLTAAVLQHPVLPPPVWEGGPPEPIIPVLLMPRTPPPAAGRAAPIQPIRLHRRPQPFAPTPVAPLPVPAEAQKPAAGPSTEPKAAPAFHPAPLPEGPKGDVKSALRQSYVGCANPLATGLNRAERDACDEKFGKGAKDAEFTGLGLAADKQRALDAVAAQKERQLRERNAPPGGNTTEARPGRSAESMADSLGVPPKP
ncbi:MAG: hypothetical protein JSS35_03225 [Proteobacteria bacterium]|nr:hypothetical protein [Pseudomonadota bacterium]